MFRLCAFTAFPPSEQEFPDENSWGPGAVGNVVSKVGLTIVRTTAFVLSFVSFFFFPFFFSFHKGEVFELPFNQSLSQQKQNYFSNEFDSFATDRLC